MSDDSSRRDFLRYLGLGTGAAAASGLLGACSTPGKGSNTGPDAAPTKRDSGGTNTADTDAPKDVVGPDTGVSTDTRSTDTAKPARDTAGNDDADGGDAAACEPTGSDVEGPFHVEGAPNRTTLAGENEPGEPILVEGTVYGPDCRTPLSNALLDIWHANKKGDYYDGMQNYRLRGQMMTDSKGKYAFETIKPGNYPSGGSLRPAHIHFSVSAPGYEPLTTQMYFKGDPHLAPKDPCGGCSSEDPTLIVDFQTRQMGGTNVLVGRFDIILTKA